MSDIQEPQKLVRTMLHEILSAQRSLSEMKMPVMAKHLSPKQRAMGCLSRAARELEDAERELLKLEESLAADDARN